MAKQKGDIRRQASLGTELKRNINNNNSTSELVLARVSKVDYEKNSIEYIVQTNGMNNSSGAIANGGARLPVSFGGKNGYGNSYGSVNTIRVNDVVLIGFVGGKKNSPIVISRYLSDEDAYLLSDYSGDQYMAPNDEDMYDKTNSYRDLYPDLTYEYHFEGKRSPSNAPDMADNVLPKLVNKCKSLSGQTGEVFKWLDDKISNQYDGKNLGLNFEDRDSGKLQLSFYSISINDNDICFSLSIRYPVTYTEDMILNQINEQLISGMRLKINRRLQSTVKDKKLTYMQNFSKIYEKDTGLNGTPVTTTGATYAREMPNIVAFGPSFPGQKGIAHKGDEWLKYSDWQMMTQIYYDCFLDELC